MVPVLRHFRDFVMNGRDVAGVESRAMVASSNFPDTRWSLILRAVDQEGLTSADGSALNEMCRLYWYPIYAFIRASGYSPENAADHTQDFFHGILTHRAIKKIDPERGRFRAFLRTSIRNHLLTAHRIAHTQKRGGKIPHVSIDHTESERKFADEPHESITPELLFDRACAIELIGRALAQLEFEHRRSGRDATFQAFQPFLSRAPSSGSYDQICSSLGVSRETARTQLHRLRKRFYRAFADEVSQTLVDPDQLEDEMKYLLDALGRCGLMSL